MLKEKKNKNETAEELDAENNTAGLETDEVNGEETDVKDENKGKKEAKDKKDSELEKLRDQLLRQMAEYDNYRKRTARERMEQEAEIVARTVTEFLPAVDNLERALSAECADVNYKKGVEMIYQNFSLTLEKLGVEVIKTDGEPFNPAYHQAVQQIADDSLESGTVAETFQKGYKIGEKIIRFAMVAVVS